MPGRDATRSKKSASPDSSARLNADQGAGADPQSLIADLQQQRDRLEAELAAARVRIVELEAGRDQALDRIAWVIDSLHNRLAQ